MNGGARPDLKLNPHLWNVRAANVRALCAPRCARAGRRSGRGSSRVPRHARQNLTPSSARGPPGVPQEPRRRGVLSGELRTASYARKGGGTTPGDVLLVALIQSGNASCGARPETPTSSTRRHVFKEETALPARLRGF